MHFLEKIKLVLYGVVAYLNLNQEAFGILMLFMVLDSALGAIKAIRLGRRFSFNKLLWGFTLKLCFLIIPLLVALLGKAVGYDFHIAVNIVMAILTLSEFYSIIGNIYAAKNKVAVKKIDAISAVLMALRKAIGNIINSLLKQLENFSMGPKINKENETK